MQIISMSQKEVDKYAVLKRLNDGQINGTQAATLLKLSVRQVRRLKSRAKKGAKALIHKNRGKPGNRKIPLEEGEMIANLLHEKYRDFGPTFAAEKLAELHDIHRSPKTIRCIQIDEGLWKPKKKRNGSDHRSWRQRKACFGEMQQFDGSSEAWLEERLLDENGQPQKLCLLASIDDATSKVTKAIFAPHEGVVPVFKFWKEYLHEHGKPRAIYVDKFSTYSMNHKTAKENPDTLTQFERATQELHIELIRAHSPQAKGRVERLFGTFQDRLIKEMRLANISTMEEANEFLKTYLPKFNERFSREPMNSTNLHTQLTCKEHRKMPSIFSRQKTRVVQGDFTISHDTQWFQITRNQAVTVCKKDSVIVERHLDDSVHLRLRDRYLSYIVLPERPKRSPKSIPWVIGASSKQSMKQTVPKPAANHPWRRRIHADMNVSNSH